MYASINILIAIVVGMCLASKVLAAFIVARKNVSTAKAKIIGSMFDFNPLSIFTKG